MFMIFLFLSSEGSIKKEMKDDQANNSRDDISQGMKGKLIRLSDCAFYLLDESQQQRAQVVEPVWN